MYKRQASATLNELSKDAKYLGADIGYILSLIHILSPAKKMIVDTDNLAPVELPVYIDKTAEVLNWMKSKSKEELKAIWKCNDKIAEQNFNRVENMDLYNRLTPAVLAYEGIARCV